MPTVKRTSKDIQGTYAVTGGPAHLRAAKDDAGKFLPSRYGFRCAEVNTRSATHQRPESLLIAVSPKGRKDYSDGPSARNLIEIWSPTVQLMNGIIFVRGFAIEYILDGQAIDNGGEKPGDNYATESGAPVFLTEIQLVPEAELNDDGTRK